MIQLKPTHKKYFDYLLKNPYIEPIEYLSQDAFGRSGRVGTTNLTDFSNNLTSYLKLGDIKLATQRLTPSVSIQITQSQYIYIDKVIEAQVLPNEVLIREVAVQNETTGKFKTVIKRWAKVNNLPVRMVAHIGISITFDLLAYQSMIDSTVKKPLIIKGLLFNQ